MKSLLFKLILPLTVISFTCITKWWHTLPIDGPDTLLYGFPLPFVGEGWHTSMSLQIFVAELLIDFLTYFSFWLLLIVCIDRFLIKIHTHKIVTILLWLISGLIISGATLIASDSNNLFYVKRPFGFEIMETRYKLFWQKTERPNYYKDHIEDIKE